VRKGAATHHYEAARPAHEALFEAVIQASHAGTWRERLRGLRQAIAAGWKLR
jgi:hypothetical protein